MEILTNTIYCTICENAKIETTEDITNNDIFYCCSLCREFEKENGVEIKVNNFDENKIIDYGN